MQYVLQLHTVLPTPRGKDVILTMPLCPGSKFQEQLSTSFGTRL